jgi:hypothetical protein
MRLEEEREKISVNDRVNYIAAIFWFPLCLWIYIGCIGDPLGKYIFPYLIIIVTYAFLSAKFIATPIVTYIDKTINPSRKILLLCRISGAAIATICMVLLLRSPSKIVGSGWLMWVWYCIICAHAWFFSWVILRLFSNCLDKERKNR